MARPKYLTRPSNHRSYRNTFFISVEGCKTEPRYFKLPIFEGGKPCICVLHATSNSGSCAPYYVLKRMKECIDKNDMCEGDEAWIVLDKDRWTEEILKEIYDWAKKKNEYNLAISDPSFDYWLLLHFEESKGAETSCKCKSRLKKYMGDCGKFIPRNKIKLENVEAAIESAKGRKCAPRTDVYKLVEKIIKDI